MIITNKLGVFMNKINVKVIVTLTFFCFLLMSSSCKGLISNNNFASLNIGDRFEENRDGYFIKLNELFFANITYKNKNVEIYKLINTDTSDYFGNSQLIYSENISECYCSESNIILYSLTNNRYVMIDCVDIGNTQSVAEIDIKNIDLSKFTRVIFPNGLF